MSSLGYIAVEKFGPESGTRWTSYITFSGLTQISRIATLDGCLCPAVIKEKTAADWDQVIQKDFMTDFFRDPDYLLNRVAEIPLFQIIGFIHQPDEIFPHGFTDSRFEFVGYDLMDKTHTSSLLNCQGFPNSFSNSELNVYGLISTYKRAKEVKDDLPAKYPEEGHAYCDIWALWIMRASAKSQDQADF